MLYKMCEEVTENVYFAKLHPDAKIPTRGTADSIGLDLYSIEDVPIRGGAGNVMVRTGIAVRLPAGTYGRVAPRSGLSVKFHINVSAGVIDRDYTGEIIVILNNSMSLGDGSPESIYNVRKGEKIAQLIIEKVCYANVVVVPKIESLGAADHIGFGSTGTGL